MTREIQTTDDFGKIYIVLETIDSVKVGEFGAANEHEAKSYHLTDGTEVDKVSETEFKIAQSGKSLFISKF